MDIPRLRLRDVRAIALSPFADVFELIDPSDIAALAQSYGGVVCVGAVGKVKSECLTLRGPLLLEAVEVFTVVGVTLPDDVVLRLRCEYRGLTA